MGQPSFSLVFVCPTLFYRKSSGCSIFLLFCCFIQKKMNRNRFELFYSFIIYINLLPVRDWIALLLSFVKIMYIDWLVFVISNRAILACLSVSVSTQSSYKRIWFKYSYRTSKGKCIKHKESFCFISDSKNSW